MKNNRECVTAKDWSGGYLQGVHDIIWKTQEEHKRRKQNKLNACKSIFKIKQRFFIEKDDNSTKEQPPGVHAKHGTTWNLSTWNWENKGGLEEGPQTTSSK